MTNIENTYERQILSVDGENMYYIQLGNIKSKKSIVIIHGSAYSALGMVPYGELYSKAGYNVILVDLPGHYGMISEHIYKFEELGDKVAGLINKLVKENKLNNKSEIQGWSLGGSVALDIAIRHPENISSVGLIDSTSNWNGIDLGSVTEENKVAITRTNIQALKSTAVSQEVTDEILANLTNVIAPAQACNNDFIVDRVLNIDDRLDQINVPVYDFFSADDMLTTLDKQKDMMSKIKCGKLYVADGYNHFTVLENPKLVFEAFKSMKSNGTGN